MRSAGIFNVDGDYGKKRIFLKDRRKKKLSEAKSLTDKTAA